MVPLLMLFGYDRVETFVPGSTLLVTDTMLPYFNYFYLRYNFDIERDQQECNPQME